MAGIYIHIPFCASRCIYCDFFSTTRLEERRRYVDALCKETSQRKSFFRQSGQPVSTLYLGGGTPSQLSISDLKRLFDTVYSNFDIADDAEVTMECNPEDVSASFLIGLKQTPVNRLSFGIQTFDDRRLRLLHRRHSSQKAVEAVEASQERGFSNISIDLMFGFPDETLDDWRQDVEQALTLGVQHLSAYSLMYENGTQLTRLRDEGKITPVDDELSLSMYELLTDQMKANGFEHYEISNFSLPGCRSRHNMSYWKGVPYLGLGAGAHSFKGNRRRWNVTSLNSYIKGVETESDYYEEETLTPTDQYNEYVMTRLRTCEGIDTEDFSKRFSSALVDYFQRMVSQHIQSGNVENADGKILFSRKGLYISDSILSDLFYIKN